MRTIWTIARKEYQLAMRSVTSYIVFVLFLIISGLGFSSSIFKVGVAELRGLYGFQHMLFIFFIPAITMSSLARERSAGTIELLSTLPIRLGDVVWGKILASSLQLLTLLAFNLIPLGIILIFGEGVDIGAVSLGFLGLFLAGCTHIAIGVFASSLPSNQVLAFILAFFISGFFFVTRFLLVLMPLGIVRHAQYFSFDYHLSGFMKGVLDIRDILFFAGFTIIFALLAEFNLQSRNLMQER